MYYIDIFCFELSFCHKLQFSKPYICATQCRRPLIFQTMNSVRSNSISVKYQRLKLSGCEGIDIRKFDFRRIKLIYIIIY